MIEVPEDILWDYRHAPEDVLWRLQRIAEFCKKHHIRKLSVFGSALRDDFTPASDVDVLVGFDPLRIPGLIRLAGMEIELSEIIGRKVDLRTAQDLSRHFRQEVVESAELQYAEG